MRTRMLCALGGLVLAAACSKGDECQRFVDKSLPVVERMLKEPTSAADKAKFLAECRKDEKARHSPLFTCVVGAKDQAAVEVCYGGAAKPGAD